MKSLLACFVGHFIPFCRYGGSGSIPLSVIYLAYNTPIVRIVSFDHITTEIVKALAGSVGLIAVIPTTAMAGIRVYSHNISHRVRDTDVRSSLELR